MFREEQPCVGVFVSNYDRDTGTGWRDHADYDVDRIYTKKPHINTLTHAHQNVQCYLSDLCVNVGFRKEVLPLPTFDTLH